MVIIVPDRLQRSLSHVQGRDELKVQQKEGCVLTVAKHSEDLVPFSKALPARIVQERKPEKFNPHGRSET